MRLLKYFALLIILFQFSCKDSDEYRVAPEFSTYLLRFEAEAAKRNINFDLEANGLIIEFADLKDNIAGLTHYENPIRIEIDKTYWNELSGYENEDLMKEDLIFHELGHGLLNRNHLNTVLENGDWKSMMCGGTKVDDRSWNINYRGVRHNYYIDELFDESISEPSFSSKTLIADTTGYIEKLSINFDNEKNTGWKIVDTTNYKTRIIDAKLQFQSKIAKQYLVFVSTVIDIQTDFSFELNIQYESTNTENNYGILFGYLPEYSTRVKDPIEYFSIDNKQSMFVGNRSCYSYFTELKKSSIIINGNNKLKVVKIGEILYYFINNVYEYCSEIETTESGTSFGFIVPKNGTVLLDNLKIAQKISSTIDSQKININNNKEVIFEVKEVEPLIQKKYNK